MPFNVGPLELVIVLVIALVILGPKRLPEVGKSIGNGMREFKDAISGNDKDDDDDEITTLQSSSSERASAPRTPAARPRAPRCVPPCSRNRTGPRPRGGAPTGCCGRVGARDGAAVRLF